MCDTSSYFLLILSFVERQKFYHFVRGYLCAKYPLTNPVEPPQTAVWLIFILSFVGRHSFYYFVRGYLCAQYAITNPVEPPQAAVCLIPLYGLYPCHRAADDILSMSSHEPYGATASVPPLPYFKSCNNVTISTKYAVNFSQLVLRFNSIVMK